MDLENQKVDMHVHSVFSVGGTMEGPHATETIEQILERAENNNVKLLSVADHETTKVYQYIFENQDILNIYSGDIVPAVEVSSSLNGEIIHIMLYGFDLEESKAIDDLPCLKKARKSTSVEKHQEHIENKQIDSNIIVSLNHIGEYPIKQSFFDFIKGIRPYIDAIEIAHWWHNREVEEECNKIAEQLNLYTFGGSDFHNPKEYEIGMCDKGIREITSSRLNLPKKMYRVQGKRK